MKKNSLARSRFMKDTVGANLVEYIMLVGLIALAAILGFNAFGKKVRSKVDTQTTSVESAVNANPQ